MSGDHRGRCGHRARVEQPHGAPGDPVTNDEVVAKFHALADRVTDRDRAEAIEHAVLGLENLGDIGELIDLLARARRGRVGLKGHSWLPPRRDKRSRQLLDGGELVVAPGVFDGISAQLAKRTGHVAAYLTGAGVAASGFGLPDIGLVTQTEMVERARMIVEALGDVPLIADADTGYGAPMNVVRTVRQYERAGVAAIQLEDQAFPKRCGHLPDKHVVDAADFEQTLHAALDARSDDDLLVVARTDARAPLGLDAAIERANIYAAAGADIIFVEAPQGVDEIERIARDVQAPLLINLVLGGLTPLQSAGRLQRARLRRRHPSQRAARPRRFRDAARPVRTQRHRPGCLHAHHARRLLQPRRHGRMGRARPDHRQRERPYA